MNPLHTSFVLLLLAASLHAAEPINIEIKILESTSKAIPHDLQKAAKTKGVDILTVPACKAETSKEGKVEILRDYQPASATGHKFQPVRTGVSISVTPEARKDGIAFNGSLTATSLIGEASKDGRTQAEVSSRTIYFSGTQKMGEEGWFDLVDQRNEAQGKIAIWIRFGAPDAAQGGRGDGDNRPN